MHTALQLLGLNTTQRTRCPENYGDFDFTSGLIACPYSMAAAVARPFPGRPYAGPFLGDADAVIQVVEGADQNMAGVRRP